VADWKVPSLDLYDYRARLQPAILFVAPVAVVALVWFPQLRTVRGGAWTAAAVAAVAAFLMAWIRSRGRAVEPVIEARIGGKPSTVILRHSSKHLASETRLRIHQALRRHGRRVPSADEEAAEPEAADDCYQSCIDWLLEQTRADALLKQENIGYGFRRNLYGAKGPALVVLGGALSFDLAAIFLHEGNTDTQIAAGWIVAATLIATAGIWLFVITPAFVTDAGFAYARRLVARVENLKAP
jgi:hypothetical protein